MTRAQCPKCHGSGDMPGHLQPYTVGNPRGMGMVRCNRCGGSGVIYDALGEGPAGRSVGFAGGSLGERVGNYVIWIFGIFFALVFANVPIFGLNWFVSGFIGLLIGSVVGGLLLAFRIGRIILWALGLGFVVLVIIELARN